MFLSFWRERIRTICTYERMTLWKSKQWIFIESSWIRFDWVETYEFASCRETTDYYAQYILSMLFSDRNNAGYIPNPGRKPPLIVDKSDGVQDRVRAAAALCFISAAPARKLLLLASFGWAGSPQNGTHGTATAMQLSSKSWFILYGFGRFAWFSWHLADRDRGKTGPATAMFFFEALTPGYAVLWSVCSRERGCCPSRHLLRFKIYLLVGGCR